MKRTLDEWEIYGKNTSIFEDPETVTVCPICKFRVVYKSNPIKYSPYLIGSELYNHVSFSHPENIQEKSHESDITEPETD